MKSILTQEIQFRIGNILMVLPEGSEVFVDKVTNSTLIEDHYVTVFPDEYMVIQ